MTVTDPNDVRRQFEAWVKDERGYTELGVSNLHTDNGYCFDSDLYLPWIAYTAALRSQAVRELAEAKRKYDRLCAAFNDTKTSTSERFLECLGIEDDVCKPLDEILNTALRTLGAGHVE